MRCVTCEKGQLDCRVKVVDGRYKGACGICNGNKKACSLTDIAYVKSGDAIKTGPPKKAPAKRATRARITEHPDDNDGLEDRLKEMEGT